MELIDCHQEIEFKDLMVELKEMEVKEPKCYRRVKILGYS
jgi:hypothetical protein